MIFSIFLACGTPQEECLLVDSFVPSRLTKGDVLWLPTPQGCAESSWEKSTGNTTSPIHLFSDDWAYTTLNEQGEHIFQYDSLEIQIDVVSADETPFHNLAYYPSRSMVSVGEEIWVSQVFSPEITVFSGNSQQEVAVGSWPVALAASVDQKTVYVVQRGSDSIGVVAVDSKKIIDTIPVGDEPTNIVLHPNGKYAYVSLITEGRIAVVDLQENKVVDIWEGVRDAYAIDLTSDGTRLIVVSKRSGHTSRYPYDSDPIEEELDAVLLSTEDGSVLQSYYDIGGTNNDVLIASDDLSFFLTTVDGSNEIELTTGETFVHYVRSFSIDSGAPLGEADLTRQDGSGGPAVTLHMMQQYEDRLFVVAEGSNTIVQLDIETLEETLRIDTTGLPRAILVDQDRIYTHGLNDYTLQEYDRSGSLLSSVSLGTDPRSEAEALGHSMFFGAGLGFAENYACNSCHADTRGDTRIWRAGPVEVFEVSRPIFWLKGTAPIGWGGYVRSSDNFGFTGSASINRRLTTEQGRGMNAFLESLKPPPRANAQTNPDGSLQASAAKGQELYNGKAGCIGCHALPLSTNNETSPEGITFDQSSIPALVGAYRYGVWMKHGEARSFSESIDQVLSWMGNDSLSADEKSDLEAFLLSMTDRHFFILNDGMEFTKEHFGVDQPIVLTMNQPVWREGLAISVTGPQGEVDIDIDVALETIIITPTEGFSFDSDYTLSLKNAEAFDGRSLYQKEERSFHTAKEPTVKMEGSFAWIVDVPTFNPVEGAFDEENQLPFSQKIYATPTQSGAMFAIEYGEGIIYETPVILDGNKLKTLPLPVSFGNSAADSTGINATVLDTDGDGIGDTAVGTTTLSGPGIWFDDLFWTLAPTIPLDACELGFDGDFPLTASYENDSLSFSWEGGDALALYVTSYSATIPLGPGQVVSNGNTYWVVETTAFPDGFSSPVSYAILPENGGDGSETHGGVVGGEMLQEGSCYKVSITRDDFTTSSFTFLYEPN